MKKNNYLTALTMMKIMMSCWTKWDENWGVDAGLFGVEHLAMLTSGQGQWMKSCHLA